MLKFKMVMLLLGSMLISCAVPKNTTSVENINYLALGDSYTIGESVCGDCNYPKQLTNKLNQTSKKKTSVKIIAKTGWTTTDLISAISAENPSTDYQLVTLLIGVNNQFQGKPFSLYEEEFVKLLEMAIGFAGGKSDNVIVLSIPDYAFTPYGQKSGKAEKITSELNKYNAFAEKVSKEKNVHFENITQITREGLMNPELVASDGLHPSKIAYEKFVELILEKASHILD